MKRKITIEYADKRVDGRDYIRIDNEAEVVTFLYAVNAASYVAALLRAKYKNNVTHITLEPTKAEREGYTKSGNVDLG